MLSYATFDNMLSMCQFDEMKNPRTPAGEYLSQLIWHILQTNAMLIEAGNRLAAPYGLTAARWQVMGCISVEALPVAEIARQLSLTRQGIQRIADDLVAARLAEYSPNPRHARAQLLGLTLTGRNALDGVMSRQAEWVNTLVEGMTPHDLNTTRETIQKLMQRLKA